MNIEHMYTPVHSFTSLLVALLHNSDRVDYVDVVSRWRTGNPDAPMRLTAFRTDGDLAEVTFHGNTSVEYVCIALLDMDGQPLADPVQVQADQDPFTWMPMVLAELNTLVGPLADATTEDVPDDTEKSPLAVGQSVQELTEADVMALPIGAVVGSSYGHTYRRVSGACMARDYMSLGIGYRVLLRHLDGEGPYTRMA